MAVESRAVVAEGPSTRPGAANPAISERLEPVVGDLLGRARFLSPKFLAVVDPLPAN